MSDDRPRKPRARALHATRNRSLGHHRLACFVYLYFRIDAAGGPRRTRASSPTWPEVFARVSWTRWLALMIPYSLLFLVIDSAVVWRVINWFNARVAYADILPVRASTYIISILNEQVGKGAMAVYLNRRDGVPGWQVGSSMLFIMFCEFYYLLIWATLGVPAALGRCRCPQSSTPSPGSRPARRLLRGLHLLYFQRLHPAGNRRSATARSCTPFARPTGSGHYAGIILLRSPALLMAVVVYTLALRLFGVERRLRWRCWATCR